MKQKFLVTIGAFLLTTVLVFGCGSGDGGGKKEKWLSYQKKEEMREKELRRTNKVRKAIIMAPVQGDSTGRMERKSEEEYNINGDKIAERRFKMDSLMIFEQLNLYKGELLQESRVKQAGGTSYAATYAYDSAGNVLRENIVNLLRRGDTLGVRTYKYDEIGNEIEAVFQDKVRGASMKKVTTYDDEGRPNTVTETRDGNPNWTEHYRYEGSTWTTTRKDGGGKVMSIFKSQYNDQELCTEISNLGPDSTLKMALNFTYDDQGRLLEQTQSRVAGQILQRLRFTYNEKGLAIEKFLEMPVKMGGNLKSVIKYEYHK